MDHKPVKRSKIIQKEIIRIDKELHKIQKSAQKANPSPWKTQIESRIPQSIYTGLNTAFTKAFSLIFQKGRSIIEQTYQKSALEDEHAIRDFAVQRKGGRKELRQLQSGAWQRDLCNLTATTLEGVGLGILGIGMPDIVIFLGTLLKGIYETALRYGFPYDTPQEQLFILKMMATSLSTGSHWEDNHTQVEEMLVKQASVCAEDVATQIQKTSSIFAMDLLLLKFIQGIPIVGVVGGLANPVYYHKVMKYVQLMYRKRYLLMQLNTLHEE